MIRFADEADYPLIARMARQFYASAGLDSLLGEYSPEAIENVCRNSTVLVFDDGGIVGFVSLLVYPHMFRPDVKVCQEMFWWVEPDNRSSGVGRSLMHAAEAYAADSGAEVMLMLAIEGPGRAAAEKIYAKGGYRPLESSHVKRL